MCRKCVNCYIQKAKRRLGTRLENTETEKKRRRTVVNCNLENKLLNSHATASTNRSKIGCKIRKWKEMSDLWHPFDLDDKYLSHFSPRSIRLKVINLEKIDGNSRIVSFVDNVLQQVCEIVYPANAEVLRMRTASKVLTEDGTSNSGAANSTVKDVVWMYTKLPSKSLQHQTSSAALAYNITIDQLKGFFRGYPFIFSKPVFTTAQHGARLLLSSTELVKLKSDFSDMSHGT